MKTPDKKTYAKTASEESKARFRSLLDQGVSKEIAWRIVYDEPDSNQPYENWPKAELEGLAADRGIKDFRDMSKSELIAALQMP